MKFRRPLQRYGITPEPVTPYQRAAQQWDDRIGSARVQSRNWRLMAFGGMCLSGAMAAGLMWQSAQSRIIPYVVEVDQLGEARSIAPAVRDYQPTDGQVAWHLGRFIRNVRSISLDPVLMRQNWLSAYDFAREGGARFLDSYARASSPFSEVGRRSVSVHVTSVIRASDRSFQVKWIETSFEGGTLQESSRWTAILTIEVRPPSSADAIRKNPLGLFVVGIDWSQELESEGSGQAASPRPYPGPHPASSSSTTGGETISRTDMEK